MRVTEEPTPAPKPEDKPDPLTLTTDEAAASLECSAQVIRRAYAAGLLPGTVNLGRGRGNGLRIPVAAIRNARLSTTKYFRNGRKFRVRKYRDLILTERFTIDFDTDG